MPSILWRLFEAKNFFKKKSALDNFVRNMIFSPKKQTNKQTNKCVCVKILSEMYMFVYFKALVKRLCYN